jgi:hypothetical protein
MLLWHNKARTDPKSLIPILEKKLTYFGTGAKAKYYSVPGKITMITNEGAAAVHDLIGALKT